MEDLYESRASEVFDEFGPLVYTRPPRRHIVPVTSGYTVFAARIPDKEWGNLDTEEPPQNYDIAFQSPKACSLLLSGG